MLNAKQIEEISEAIKDHFGAMIYLMTGKTPSGVSFKRLVDRGVLASGPSVSSLSDAYVYGLLSGIDPEKLKGKTVSEIADWIKRIPLSEIERTAVGWLSESAASYCQGLGNRFDLATGRFISDSVKEAAMMGKIRETLADKAAQRKTRKEIITALRDATKDAHRDWQRIVNTELHQAYTYGQAKAIKDHFGDESTVIVRPFPDACASCKAAYLDKKTGVPKVFKLKTLASRNNVGRKAAELRAKPGLPPLHPHCMCQVHYFDSKIHKFDKKGRIVLKLPKGQNK
jgi:hypothetical protein